MVAERAKYVVDTAALGARQRVDACRLVLTVAAEDIATFETDIPWGVLLTGRRTCAGRPIS